MIRAGTAEPSSITVSDPIEAARTTLATETGATAAIDKPGARRRQ